MLDGNLIDLFKLTDEASVGTGSDKTHELLLYALCVLINPQVIVEIGCRKGASTIWLQLGCKGSIYCVDPFVKSYGGSPEYLTQFLNLLNEIKPASNIKVIIKTSEQAIIDRDIPGAIDLLFIDGSHERSVCRFDIENYVIRVPVGGVVVIHDIYLHEDVAMAINDSSAILENFYSWISKTKEGIWI